MRLGEISWEILSSIITASEGFAFKLMGFKSQGYYNRRIFFQQAKGKHRIIEGLLSYKLLKSPKLRNRKIQSSINQIKQIKRKLKNYY